MTGLGEKVWDAVPELIPGDRDVYLGDDGELRHEDGSRYRGPFPWATFLVVSTGLGLIGVGIVLLLNL